MVRTALLIVVMSLAWLRWPAAGRADAAPEGAEAQALFAEGLEYSTARKWLEAREAFLRSIALVPRASTYFNLSLACLELQLGREALDALDAFERLADPSAHARFQARASELRARAQALVATLVLKLEPAAAELRIDGLLEPGGGERVIFLNPGQHRVEVRSERHLPAAFEVDLPLRTTLQRRVELEPVSPSPAVSSPPEPRETTLTVAPTSAAPARSELTTGPTQRFWRKPALWITVAALVVVGAGVGVGVALGQKERDAERPEPHAGSTGWTF